jgi:biotin carboxyl carrier protein
MTTKKLKITVSGKTYDVLVEVLGESGAPQAPRVAPVAPVISAPAPVAAPRPAAPAAVGPGVVAAPLAGLVVSVDVNVGDTVAAEQTVVMMEAMKMQTAIASTGAGKVLEIYVKRGDTVQEGSALLKIG